MSALLEIEQITHLFGRVPALDRVSTSIVEGEIRGLIGPNGAGKTTLVNVLSGFVTPTSGRLLFDGRRLEATPAHTRVRDGIGRTFQTPQLCRSMPVLDNIVIGGHQRLGAARFRNAIPSRSRPRVGLGALRQEAAEIAGQVGLADLVTVRAGALSYGHMRLLEIARALMARPRILLLDEPVAGMNETESRDVAEIVESIAEGGTTVVVIEHDMPFVMELCHRITVLDHGVVIAEDTPAQIQRHPEVERVYLGTLGDEE